MQRTRRPWLFALLGLLLCAAAGYLMYDYGQPHVTEPGPQKYTYAISQSAAATPHYKQNNFFAGGSPGANATAYVANLTDYLNSRLNYTFTGSTAANLKYSYQAQAVLRSTFSGKDATAGPANVWTKTYTLMRPVTGAQTTKVLSLHPNVQIPFADYAAAGNKFRAAYNVPVTNEVDVLYTVTVSGTVSGVPFSNTQTATISVPLDEVVYKIAVKFNAAASGQVASHQARQLQDVLAAYEYPAGVALGLLGIGLIIYGFRKQIIKSPYQRELARIYRYNDGIIVRARRPVSLARKTIIDLASFDDLLSIEEDTGGPIVANELSDTVTRFIITDDDTAYVFTLGGDTPEDDSDDDTPDEPPSPPPPPAKPAAKAVLKTAPKLPPKSTAAEADKQLVQRVDRMMKIQ